MLYDSIASADVSIPPSLSPAARGFIQGLLHRDPDRRLGAHQRRGEDDIKGAQFLKHINWDKAKEMKLSPPVVPAIAARRKSVKVCNRKCSLFAIS